MVAQDPGAGQMQAFQSVLHVAQEYQSVTHMRCHNGLCSSNRVIRARAKGSGRTESVQAPDARSGPGLAFARTGVVSVYGPTAHQTRNFRVAQDRKNR